MDVFVTKTVRMPTLPLPPAASVLILLHSGKGPVDSTPPGALPSKTELKKLHPHTFSLHSEAGTPPQLFARVPQPTSGE